MGRPRDEHYWNQVTKEENGMLKCKHCGKKFKGGVARIKAHLGKEKGQGIALCSVPDNEGVKNNVMAGSSNSLQVVNRMNSLQVAGGDRETIYSYFDGSMNPQNDTGPIDIEEETGLAHLEDMVRSGGSSFERETNEVKASVDELSREEEQIKGELQWLESRGKKRKRQVDDWLKGVEDLRRRVGENIESLPEGWSRGPAAVKKEIWKLRKQVKQLTEAKPSVLSNELVGINFEENVKKMWKLLRDDNVFIVGVHGMAGVGKTCLATHIRNQITRKATSDFENVFWVTVSQDFSISKLQDCIAKRIGVKLDEDDEIFERAEILSSALEKKEKSVLVLDDVWNHIDLQKVGIPLQANGAKLILTSRQEYVFQQMDCLPSNMIRMEPLPEEDAWELFSLKLGCYGTPAKLPDKVEEIARSVVKKCDGLPLGISVMARTMKGVNNFRMWKHALNKLEDSSMREEMEEEVFKVLKLSYDYLEDKNIQDCFLHCALYNYVSTNELIMNLVEEGLVEGKESLEKAFCEGHAILDKLKGHSLLLEVEDDEREDDYLRMHDLVRDVACHILKGRYMVKCEKNLTKIPEMQEWVPHLEKVSLIDNNIEEIPDGASPKCPWLSTLVFSHNKLRRVPDCFFKYMNSAAVLDLSYNQELTVLPNSFSSLWCLKSLLLKGCHSLEHVPPLGELQELSRLVISDTSIKQVPEGLAMLVKLRWLDLSWNENLIFVHRSVLLELTSMQYLHLRLANITVEVENLHRMSKLEYFAGKFDFEDNMELSDYVLERGFRAACYKPHHGVCPRTFSLGYKEIFGEPNQYKQLVHFGDCNSGLNHWLSTDLRRLCVSANKQWSGGLCDALSFEAPSSLRIIQIGDCSQLQTLFCFSDLCSLCTYLENLQSLFLYNLEKLDVIWKEKDIEDIPPCPSCNQFSHLNHLEIRECHRMEKLLTPQSLQKLPNLAHIAVSDCNSMKKIFAGDDDDDDNNDSTMTISKSMVLRLQNLPQLKTLSTRTIVSKFPPTVQVFYCPNLIEGSLRYKPSDS